MPSPKTAATHLVVISTKTQIDQHNKQLLVDQIKNNSELIHRFYSDKILKTTQIQKQSGSHLALKVLGLCISSSLFTGLSASNI